MLPCFKELGMQHQAHHSRNIFGGRDPPQRRQFFIEPNKFIEVVTPLLDAFAQHRRIVDGWNDGVDTQPLLPILNRCCFYESLRRSLGTGIRRQSG